ncbi:dienelactone hydrolase family protein [Novosphingobium ovatum]|uniref:dienelactone hydrolase family protein n=1 Tax=Novosphingobium ovatum TaxID=1908523 RepID=UPI001D1174E0|nr:dienelactone hydrolase family protein [Novosphingobium ovatum]
MAEAFSYTDRGTALSGLLFRPAGAVRGAIVVFPTIANVTPHVEVKAQALADAGFIALIADFYGEPVASFEASRPLAEKLRGDVAHYRARCHAAVAALRDVAGAGVPMAAIGFCMGGQAVLELARDGADLALVASFHGLLTTGKAAEPGAVKARILVCHGDADPLAPRDHVRAFWEEMDAAGANWHFHSYAGVKHGFTEPGADKRGMAALGYDASADRQSWAALYSLLDELIPA